MYDDLIRRTVLFEGLNDAEYEKALRFFDARRVHYGKGEFISVILEPLRSFGIVLAGAVQVCTDDLDGNRRIMANVESGGIFGESLCYLDRGEEVYIVATSACDILWMSVDALKSGDMADPFALNMANRFIRLIAVRALALNGRIQILTRPNLRMRVMALLSQYEKRYGESFVLPFSREDMAVYLGVNRSALSRELSLMQRDGIITYHRSEFTLLRRD